MSSTSATLMQRSDSPAARLLRVSLPREDGTVSLLVGREGAKAESYTLKAAQYRALGAPVAGESLSGEAYALLLSLAREGEAIARAVRLLSFGDHSARALCRKLRERGFGREEAEAAVAHMIDRGYIREEEQACRMATALANRKCWGRRRILAYLANKGYEASTVRAAIATAEAEGDIDFEEIRARLLSEKCGEDATEEECRALLYKQGF